MHQIRLLGGKPDKKITINLSPGVTSYYWRTTTTTNPKPEYAMYESYNNYNVASTYAVMKITFKGYSSFTIYINSYGESCCDYTIAGNLDSTTYTSGIATTSSKSYSPTTFNATNWTTVTYSGITTAEHFIYVTYRKDSSVNSYNDRGYVLIDMNQ